MSSWLIQIIVKAFLEWLKSLWERFVQKQKHIEQGRKEVLEDLLKKEKDVDAEIEKLRNSNTTFNTSIDELRDRANRSNSMHSN